MSTYSSKKYILWAFALLGFFLLSKVLVSKIVLEGQEPWVKVRLDSAVQAIPDIARDPTPAVLAFGNSDLEVDFAPTLLESELQRQGTTVKAYNFGFRFLGPDVLHLLAKRLETEMQRNGKKLDLVLFRFTPYFATLKYESQSEKLRLDTISDLVDAGTLMKELWPHPEVLTEALLSKVALTGYSTSFSSAIFKRKIYPVERRISLNYYRRLWINHTLNTFPAWDKEKRGEFYFNFPDGKKEFQRLIEWGRRGGFDFYSSSLDWHNEMYDFSELRFSQKMIQENIEIAKILQRISKKMIYIVPPEFPLSGGRTMAARARYEAAFDEIRAQAPAPIWDFSGDSGFGKDDFIDILHLREEARQRFNILLAQKVQSALNE